MDFEFIFSPDNLIQARRSICKNDKEQLDFINPGFEQEQFINRMLSSSPDMAKATALSLSDREVEMLAGYIPYNHYELDEKPLCEILKYRLDENSCRTLFYQWQESFNNPQCNALLRGLVETNREFKNVLVENHIPEKVFLRLLDSRNIPLSYDEELIGKRFVDGADFNNKLRYYGVTENSLLDIECKRALMTFCGHADYLECSEDNILYIIRSYDNYMLKKFVVNFLSKMDIWELQVYPGVAEYLRSIVSHKRSAAFAEFFSDINPVIQNQYLNWINVYKINKYFENDDRSRFWKQFRFENVIRYPVCNMVAMEFEEYIAVEFLDVDNGTIYICDKHSFKQYFYLRLDSMGEKDLMQYFQEHKEHCIFSRSHTGKWQSHVIDIINKRQMGERLPK